MPPRFIVHVICVCVRINRKARAQFNVMWQDGVIDGHKTVKTRPKTPQNAKFRRLRRAVGNPERVSNPIRRRDFLLLTITDGNEW